MDRKRKSVPVKLQQFDVNINFLNESEEKKSAEPWRYLEVFAAEFLGTGLLLFVGCMASVPALAPQGVPPLQSALTFGMVVSSLIQIFGHISSAHFNPAVTTCFFMQGSLTLPMAINYLAAEILGAVTGYGLLKVVTPLEALGEGCMGCTLVNPSVGELEGTAVEFVSTALLVFVVCSVTDQVNASKQDSAPLKFGFLMIALSLAAGPFTGASMNPARSFAPALLNNVWDHHWVYWIGPMSAGIVVPIFYQGIFQRKWKPK